MLGGDLDLAVDDTVPVWGGVAHVGSHAGFENIGVHAAAVPGRHDVNGKTATDSSQNTNRTRPYRITM